MWGILWSICGSFSGGHYCWSQFQHCLTINHHLTPSLSASPCTLSCHVSKGGQAQSGLSTPPIWCFFVVFFFLFHLCVCWCQKGARPKRSDLFFSLCQKGARLKRLFVHTSLPFFLLWRGPGPRALSTLLFSLWGQAQGVCPHCQSDIIVLVSISFLFHSPWVLPFSLIH